MKLRIFKVFHRSIDERLIFQPFTRAEIDEFFRLYAVSERYPLKNVIRADGSSSLVSPSDQKVTLESKLRWYEPALQARGFMEASCYIHVLKNQLHVPFDYIGVAQYDMRWTAAAATILRELSGDHAVHSARCFGIVCGKLMDNTGQFNAFAYADILNWDFLLSSYNKFFARNWTRDMLMDKPFTLYQTYLLPRAEFVALASWLGVLCEEVYPWAAQPPYQTHWGALSGYVERAESLFIAARLHEGQADLHALPLEHDDTIAAQLGIKREHYAAS